MSLKGIAGTYEIEVLLGNQEVCLLEFDLPETKKEFSKIKLDTPQAEEYFRGLLAGVFSSPGDDDDTRLIQIYDLLDGLATLREAIDGGEEFEKIKELVNNQAQDEISQACLQYFLLMAETINRGKTLQYFGQFQKFLLAKRESLPKVVTPTKQSKDTPRWDRVAKQAMLVTDEPTQDIEVNALEEESVEESDTVETEWRDTGVDTDTGIEGDVDSDEQLDSEEP